MKARKFCYECGTYTVHIGLIAADECVVCEHERRKGDDDKKLADLLVFDRLFKRELFGHNRNKM